MSVFVLSPVLKTLTDSISTDTIYAMTVSSCYIDLLLKGFTCAKKCWQILIIIYYQWHCEFCLFFVSKNDKVSGLLSEYFYLHHILFELVAFQKACLAFFFSLIQAWQQI